MQQEENQIQNMRRAHYLWFEEWTGPHRKTTERLLEAKLAPN